MNKNLVNKKNSVNLCSDNYQQAIDILTSQGKFYINLGLERVQKILGLLNEQRCQANLSFPHPKPPLQNDTQSFCRQSPSGGEGAKQKPDLLSQLKFIHVAGTNGKGSVCAMLSAILKERGKRAEGTETQRCKDAKMQSSVELLSHQHNHLPNSPTQRVGLFTSPHIFEYTERIKINDVQIDKEIFAQKVIDIVKLSQKNDIHLTEFEILTIVALEYFAQNNVDIVILETGLGGRLDATNIIEENICSIITNISFDHTERLGDTIEKIATEKAGIIKQNCPVIINSNNLGFEVVKKVAEEKNSTLISPACHCEERSDEAIQGHKFFGLPRQCSAPPRNDTIYENLVLKGTYQKENLTLVIKAIEILNQQGFNITKEAIEEGLKNVKHPCRFEYLKEENIIIDGAHNPDGTKALRESLDYYFPNQKIKFIFGCLKNKDYAQMMKNLFTSYAINNGEEDKLETFAPEIYFYQFDNENSCTYRELADACEFDSKPFDEFKKDFNTLTVVCGSFYMIKELLLKMGIK